MNKRLNLQRRNKPVAPPAGPAAAPFFLPTVPGLTPQFAAPSETDEKNKVQFLSISQFHVTPAGG